MSMKTGSEVNRCISSGRVPARPKAVVPWPPAWLVPYEEAERDAIQWEQSASPEDLDAAYAAWEAAPWE